MPQAQGSADPDFARLLEFVEARLPAESKARQLLRALATGPKTNIELEKAASATDAYLATLLTRFRTHLDHIFDGKRDGRPSPEKVEGTRLYKRLRLGEHAQNAEGPRRLELVPDRNRHAVSQFWASHGSMIDKTYLVWAEPLVFYEERQGHRSYVRFLDVNDPRDVKDHPAEGLQACYGYQSSGDIESVHMLEQELARQMIGTQRCLIRETTRDDVKSHHAVIIGNSRMNPHVGPLQGGFDFTIERDHLKKKGVEKPFYDYAPTSELEHEPAYVVLTRRRNLKRHDKVVTMISGNQGRAIEQVVEMLVSDELLEPVWERVRDEGKLTTWPATFQVLFEVRVERNEFVADYQQAVAKDVKIYDRRLMEA